MALLCAPSLCWSRMHEPLCGCRCARPARCCKEASRVPDTARPARRSGTSRTWGCRRRSASRPRRSRSPRCARSRRASSTWRLRCRASASAARCARRSRRSRARCRAVRARHRIACGLVCWHHARAGTTGQHEQLPLAACRRTDPARSRAPLRLLPHVGTGAMQHTLHPLLQAGQAAAARTSVQERTAFGPNAKCLTSAAGRGAVPDACAGRQARARCSSTA